eukprot:CAMPEP_0197620442 /NCGR_PEP_ID=MMETSP1338-20131121/1266_1 /TAXON_ID=43686 ORGANISM="Pelagodinium beii, Strain RCC1491" /NCGR_SAMPLE_ID=MMETSP1338 /ASSEMBLY_ACC=CAM_ASM_000754 /LENGTH=104 /DNA_ID=CAMNT_0043189623 /DNA_START=150 /DNA_END=465 /DNA_ORIENTATION=-
MAGFLCFQTSRTAAQSPELKAPELSCSVRLSLSSATAATERRGAVKLRIRRATLIDPLDVWLALLTFAGPPDDGLNMVSKKRTKKETTDQNSPAIMSRGPFDLL